MIVSRRSHHYPSKRGKYFRINLYITAQTLRVLDETGKQIGVFTKDEALRRARNSGLDLVEIAPLAKPPVAKIIDFKKFRYLESKKEREARKKTKHVGIKEVVLSPFIGEHDFLIKLNRGREFLNESHKLRATVKFKGRQLGKKEFGYDVLKRLITKLEDISKVEIPPRFEGRSIITQLSPVKKTINDHENENKKINTQTLQADQKRQASQKAPELKTPQTQKVKEAPAQI